MQGIGCELFCKKEAVLGLTKETTVSYKIIRKVDQSFKFLSQYCSLFHLSMLQNFIFYHCAVCKIDFKLSRCY